MRYLFLDTSFILRIVKFGKNFIEMAEDYFDEKFYPIIIKNVKNELKTLANKKIPISKNAQFALKIVSNFKEIEEEEFINLSVDEALFKICKKYKGVIATADKEILHKALKKGFAVIFLKKEGVISCYKD